MNPNLAIGEMAVEYNGESWLLRPSIYAMSRIDDPMGTLASSHFALQAAFGEFDHLGFKVTPRMITSAISVLQACADRPLPDTITGWVQSSSAGDKLLYRPGAMHYQDIILFASHLLKFGMIGRPTKRKSKGSSDVEDFDAVKLAGRVAASLDIPIKDAWQMCIIEVQEQYEAKFPETDSKGRPVKEVPKIKEDKLRKIKERMKKAVARARALKQAAAEAKQAQGE